MLLRTVLTASDGCLHTTLLALFTVTSRNVLLPLGVWSWVYHAGASWPTFLFCCRVPSSRPWIFFCVAKAGEVSAKRLRPAGWRGAGPGARRRTTAAAAARASGQLANILLYFDECDCFLRCSSILLSHSSLETILPSFRNRRSRHGLLSGAQARHAVFHTPVVVRAFGIASAVVLPDSLEANTATARILADLGLDADAVAAALLHNTLDASPLTRPQVLRLNRLSIDWFRTSFLTSTGHLQPGFCSLFAGLDGICALP